MLNNKLVYSMDYNPDLYLAAMREMERCWQAAVSQVMYIRETQLATTHRAIRSLERKLHQEESHARERELECKELRNVIRELNLSFDSTLKEKESLIEGAVRNLEEKDKEHEQEMECKTRMIEEMNVRQKEAVKAMNDGSRHIINDLESQLEAMKLNEEKLLKEISNLEEDKVKNERLLNDWNRVSGKMCEELSDVKNKLQSSRFANSKLREEISFWKTYCEKVEDERKAVMINNNLEQICDTKLKQIISCFQSQKNWKTEVLDTINRFESKTLEIMRRLEGPKPSTLFVTSVQCQTEDLAPIASGEYKEELMKSLKIREKQLEDDVKKLEMELENTVHQNCMLKEVIKSMKNLKENQQNDQIEEVIRVAKLENSVQLLKNNILNEQKDVCVWSALNDMKKEVMNLKNKNLLLKKSMKK